MAGPLTAAGVVVMVGVYTHTCVCVHVHVYIHIHKHYSLNLTCNYRFWKRDEGVEQRAVAGANAVAQRLGMLQGECRCEAYTRTVVRVAA